MTHDEAMRWAVQRLVAWINHPAIQLHSEEAHRAAEAMTLLTSDQYDATHHNGGAHDYWRVRKRESVIQTNKNLHKSGS